MRSTSCIPEKPSASRMFAIIDFDSLKALIVFGDFYIITNLCAMLTGLVSMMSATMPDIVLSSISAYQASVCLV